MPTDWNENIVIAELVDEPELSEEIAGIFDRLGTPAPGRPAAPAGPTPHIVLNFSGVTYLNSSHLAALLRMRKALQERGRSLILCSLGEDLWSVMTLTGLDRIFQIVPDPLTALASLQLEEEPQDR